MYRCRDHCSDQGYGQLLSGSVSVSADGSWGCWGGSVDVYVLKVHEYIPKVNIKSTTLEKGQIKIRAISNIYLYLSSIFFVSARALGGGGDGFADLYIYIAKRKLHVKKSNIRRRSKNHETC
jgi:hypothetical protein